MGSTAGGGVTVCSMCGDVGFPDKLFRCARCCRRFQHSYCTNYYGEGAPAKAGAGVCDWCLRDAAAVVGKGRKVSAAAAAARQMEGSEERPFYNNESRGKSKAATGDGGGEQEGGGDGGGRRVSNKAAVRRYKLLKDVSC
ncbi:hypothetical protein GUJ93_ZPchr0006g44573 [Zizania palustris]|uniref:PHD-type zinc finger plants domain-containing protein n=1 Tax=Zizania palustris TaxID=103762 RepID=A0A8J5SUE5_ZIZPA|nr:hypothetical protein GUJ93_ZPchr0006g44573 [Zizania palustris]